MRALLHFIFWSSILGVLVRSGFLIVKDYPRTDEIKLGEDVVRLISSVAFIAWSAYLLWR